MPDWKLGMFDWNGTLLDDRDLMKGCLQAIFRRYELPTPSWESFCDEVGLNFMPFYQKHGIPADTNPDDLRAIRKKFIKRRWRQAGLYSTARTLLWACKKNSAARVIVSAEQKDLLEKCLENFNLHDCFDAYFAQAYDKEIKIREVLNTFQCKPEEAFYVDDIADGILAAKRVGVTSIGVAHGYNSKAKLASSKPDYLADNLFEVIRILFKVEPLGERPWE
ncbi:MAG: HAD family hydrolase [Candidatus Harrisonbacteria bacterium]|nr:HAD family hydrolase [Candidatus Harrisonbacteria bacterium]